MKGRIARTLGAVAALATAVPTAAGAGTPSGRVYVTTLPSGADIWVDGTYVGRAPVLVDALFAGKHAISVTKSGWIVREAVVDVPAGGVAMSSVRLAPGAHGGPGGTGSILVRAMPAGATLALDGAALANPLGSTVAVSAGPHRLTLTTPRGPMTRGIDVYPDTVSAIVLQAVPSAGTSAVSAPAEDYLPTDDFSVNGDRVVIRYGGHVVVARVGDPSFRVDGTPTAYGSAPDVVAGRLYLPLPLLERLTGDTSKGH